MNDAHKIAPLLRKQDRLEILAASGVEPEVAIPRAFSEPKGICIFAERTNGDPIMIAGVRPTHHDAGAIWMVGTDALEDLVYRFPREARRYVAEWHKQFPILWNTAWAENDLHLRWLKFMGFTLHNRVRHNGTTFIEFASVKYVR